MHLLPSRGGTSGRLTSPLPRESCSRGTCTDVFDAFAVQVHRADPVVVRPVPAVLALEQVQLLVPVRLLGVPACRAGLGGVSRVDDDHPLPVQRGLVREHLTELVERPRHGDVAVSRAHLLGGGTDAGQVFQHEQRAPRVSVDECLRDLMVHIGHITVFSRAELSQPLAGRWGLPSLQLLAGGFERASLVFDRMPVVKGGLALAVVRDRQEVDAEVHADDVGDTGVVEFGERLRHGDVQEPFLVFVHQFGRAEPPRPVEVPPHALARIVQLDPAVQRVHAEPVPGERVVAVPDEVVLGALELDPGPRVPVRPRRLVPGDHRLHDRLGHLALQAEPLPDLGIVRVVEARLVQVPRLEDVTRQPVTGRPVRVHRCPQGSGLRVLDVDLYFCSDCRHGTHHLSLHKRYPFF